MHANPNFNYKLKHFRMKKILYLSLIVLFTNQISFAQAYIVEDFKVEVDISATGKMDVKESISVLFNEERRGIFRDIPYKYKLNGKNYRINISNFDVRGYKSQTSNQGDSKRIRIGDSDIYITGRHQYDISYSVENAIIEYEDGQEFYWNLTGNEWDTEIQNASFTINLPKAIQLAPELIKVYTGREGSTASNAEVEQSSSKQIFGKTTQSLRPGEGLTIATLLPIDYMQGLPNLEVVKKSLIDKEKNKPWYLAIPLALWGLIFGWWRNMKNKNLQRTKYEPEYYPPEGLTSAHVGAYIDHTVNKRDVISMIPFWATEGFIVVRGLPDGDMVLDKQKDLPSDYPPYELDFFEKIFEDSDSIAFSDAKHKFGTTYYKVKRQIEKELEAAGYYDENYVRIFKSYRWLLVVLAIIALGILVIIYANLILVGIGIIFAGILSAFYPLFTAPLSEYGKEVYNKIRGLEVFLKSDNGAQVQEILKEDPDYFGRILPFAVALGLDKQWLQSFDRVYDVAPAWYIMPHYGHRPTFTDFSNNFQVKEITRAFTSMPVSSGTGGGSSFSSGGFSGGGFGGGGGGSW